MFSLTSPRVSVLRCLWGRQWVSQVIVFLPLLLSPGPLLLEWFCTNSIGCFDVTFCHICMVVKKYKLCAKSRRWKAWNDPKKSGHRKTWSPLISQLSTHPANLCSFLLCGLVHIRWPRFGLGLTEAISVFICLSYLENSLLLQVLLAQLKSF